MKSNIIIYSPFSDTLKFSSESDNHLVSIQINDGEEIEINYDELQKAIASIGNCVNK